MEHTFIAVLIGGAVGHSMGYVAGRYADLGIGAMAMFIAMGAIIAGKVLAVEVYIQDT